MNRDSRQNGKGKAPPKRRVPKRVKAKLLDPKSAEALAIIRAQALTGLSDLVGLALATIMDCLKEGPTRAQGSRSSDARYVLDVVLDRIPEAAELPEDAVEASAQTPIDQLAERRAQLQKLLQAQRKDMDRSKRK